MAEEIYNIRVAGVDYDIHAAVADTVGSTDVGSATNPIYLNDGVATASTATVGSATKPVYLNGGVLTASSSTVGSSSKPVYLSSGTLAACTNIDTGTLSASGATTLSSTLKVSGATTLTTPLNMSDGTNTCSGLIKLYDDGDGSTNNGSELEFTAHGNTFVGAGESPANLHSALLSGEALDGESYNQTGERLYLSADTQVYLESYCSTIANRRAIVLGTDGVLKAATSNASIQADKLGTSTVGSSTKPIYLSSGVATASSSTVGGTAQPVYLNSGTITACSSTVGSSTVPTYLSSGKVTASTSTVGSSTKPIYLSSGTLTASSSTVGSSTQPVYLSSGTITKCGGSLNNLTQLRSGSVAIGKTFTASAIADYTMFLAVLGDSSAAYNVYVPCFAMGTAINGLGGSYNTDSSSYGTSIYTVNLSYSGTTVTNNATKQSVWNVAGGYYFETDLYLWKLYGVW